jgi:hypothetical protein
VLSGRALLAGDRITQAEARGERKAFREMEWRWNELYADFTANLDELMIARDKLERLSQLGLIDAEWLERDRAAILCSLPAAPACAQRPADPAPACRVPRVRFL